MVRMLESELYIIEVRFRSERYNKLSWRHFAITIILITSHVVSRDYDCSSVMRIIHNDTHKSDCYFAQHGPLTIVVYKLLDIILIGRAPRRALAIEAKAGLSATLAPLCDYHILNIWEMFTSPGVGFTKPLHLTKAGLSD